MEIDERLRIGLRREEALVDDRTDDALDDVLRRVRRRRSGRWTAAAAVAAVAVAVTVSVLPGLASREDGLPAAPSPTPSPATALHGTWSVVVEDDPAAQGLGIVGSWEITVRPDGVMEIAAPNGYEHPTSGAAHVTSANRLTTNALVSHPGCQSGAAGTYEWRRSGTRVLLEVVDDTCLARAALLAGQPWERVP